MLLSNSDQCRNTNNNAVVIYIYILIDLCQLFGIEAFIRTYQNILFFSNFEKSSYMHCLLFPQCFQKALSWGAPKVVNVWYRFKSLPNNKILASTILNAFTDHKFNVIKFLSMFLIWKKTLWEKEKMLIPTFSPFPAVFYKSPLFHVC